MMNVFITVCGERQMRLSAGIGVFHNFMGNGRLNDSWAFKSRLLCSFPF